MSPPPPAPPALSTTTLTTLSLSLLPTAVQTHQYICIDFIENYNLCILVNCSNTSPAAGVTFRPFSDTTEGANISFNCEPGLEPQREDVSVCSSNGSWVPDPAHKICSIPHPSKTCSSLSVTSNNTYMR